MQRGAETEVGRSWAAPKRVSGPWGIYAGWRRPAVAAVLGFEREGFHDNPLVGVGRARERVNGASGERLDRRDELLGGRDLQEHPALADALLFAHFNHRALGRQQRVL